MTVSAKDIMTKKVISVNEDMPVSKLTELFDENKITAAPVVGADGQLVGIVTKSDVLGHFIDLKIEVDLKNQLADLIEIQDGQDITSGSVDPDVPVGSVMTTDPITVPADMPLEKIAAVMALKRIHKLIIREGSEIVGIISPMDFLFHIGGIKKDAG